MPNTGCPLPKTAFDQVLCIQQARRYPIHRRALRTERIHFSIAINRKADTQVQDLGLLIASEVGRSSPQAEETYTGMAQELIECP